MQYGVLDWILEQKEDTNGETGKIQKLWSLVNGSIPMLVSSFGQRYHGNVRWLQWGKPGGKYTGTPCAVLPFFWNLQLFKK